MESIVKKYQQRFRKVKEEMDRWNEVQSRLVSQFTNASSIILRLQVLQDSKNYGVLRCVEGIQEAVLVKQMESLQTILLSMNETMEKFHSVVLSLEKMVRDGRQLVKGGSTQMTVKMLQKCVGIKPSIADCLDGLSILCEMHQAEDTMLLLVQKVTEEVNTSNYEMESFFLILSCELMVKWLPRHRLKLSVISAISSVALKASATNDLSALQQLLVDQPNIPKEEVQFIFDIIFAEEIA